MSNRRKDKPQIRPTTQTFDRTFDSIQNFLTHTGKGTGNLNDGGHYGFNPVSRNRLELEWAYRGSWICGTGVDCIAEDMTRAGVTINSSDKPEQIEELHKEMQRLGVWAQLCSAIKWSRLYGGALGFLMIDGQKPETPLRMETIQKSQFKGILPIDRWMVQPSMTDLVQDMGRDYGKPKYYDTVSDINGGIPRMKMHYSRVIRLEGVELPWNQRITEQLWGQSVLERVWDRLIAFDSVTTGMAQLVYKAHLRTYKVERLREIIAMGGPAYSGLLKQMEMIRIFQSSEGLTLMDAKDEFEAHQYAFGGLSDVMDQFKEQLSGAWGIPLVKFFGQSPAGFATGDADIRNYYDGIAQKQETILRDGMERLTRIAYVSTFGKEPPSFFQVVFNPLWQLTGKEKSEITQVTAAAITSLYESQIIDRATALKEARTLAPITGFGSNITDEAISEAESDPAPSAESLGLEIPRPEPPVVKPAENEKLRAVK